MTAAGGRRSERGFTMVELLVSLGLLLGLLTFTFTLFGESLRANADARGCAEDLLGLRRTAASVERDLRNAARVEILRTTGDGVRLVVEGPAGSVLYQVRDGLLTRTCGNDRSILARRVASFEVAREGALVRAAIEVDRRDPAAPRRPRLAFAVALPAERAP